MHLCWSFATAGPAATLCTPVGSRVSGKAYSISSRTDLLVCSKKKVQPLEKRTFLYYRLYWTFSFSWRPPVRHASLQKTFFSCGATWPSSYGREPRSSTCNTSSTHAFNTLTPAVIMSGRSLCMCTSPAPLEFLIRLPGCFAKW